MTNAVITVAAAVSCWTNLAGHVISARPLSVAGGKAVFEVPAVASGAAATNSYPLSVFPEGERRRIVATIGASAPPADAAEANRRAFAAREEERIAAMERDGLLTAEEAATRRTALRGFMRFKGAAAARPAADVR